MDAVYQWIQQLALFAVIAFLALYLSGNQEKKGILRFYLSLLMLFLVLQPIASILNWNEILTEKLTSLEINQEIEAAEQQIQEAVQTSGREILDDTSEKALSWIKNLAESKNLEFLEGKLHFDENLLAESGELVISSIEVSVSGSEKEAAQTQTDMEKLQEEIAEAFQVESKDVVVRSR